MTKIGLFWTCSILSLYLLFILSGCAGPRDNKIKFTFEPKLSDGPVFAASRIDKAVVEIKEKDGPVVKKIDLTDSFKKNQSESIEFTTNDIIDYMNDKVYQLSAIFNGEITWLNAIYKTDGSPVKKVFEGTFELPIDFEFKRNVTYEYVVPFEIFQRQHAHNMIPYLWISSSNQSGFGD